MLGKNIRDILDAGSQGTGKCLTELWLSSLFLISPRCRSGAVQKGIGPPLVRGELSALPRLGHEVSRPSGGRRSQKSGGNGELILHHLLSPNPGHALQDVDKCPSFLVKRANG